MQSLDVLECIIGCRSEEHAVVEKDTLAGASANCRASVNDIGVEMKR